METYRLMVVLAESTGGNYMVPKADIVHPQSFTTSNDNNKGKQREYRKNLIKQKPGKCLLLISIGINHQ